MKLAHALPWTCGGALWYAPVLSTGAAVLRSYDSRSHRRPEIFPTLGVRGEYSVQQNQGAARLGLACLATAQTFPGAAAPSVDRNGIPCWLLDTVSRCGARLKGSTFPGAAFLRFPTSQRETCTHRNPVLHRRADHGTDEDQLP